MWTSEECQSNEWYQYIPSAYGSSEEVVKNALMISDVMKKASSFNKERKRLQEHLENPQSTPTQQPLETLRLEDAPATRGSERVTKTPDFLTYDDERGRSRSTHKQTTRQKDESPAKRSRPSKSSDAEESEDESKKVDASEQPKKRTLLMTNAPRS